MALRRKDLSSPLAATRPHANKRKYYICYSCTGTLLFELTYLACDKIAWSEIKRMERGSKGEW